MRPPVNPTAETRTCAVCGRKFVWVRRKQTSCGSCRGRRQHNKPKWKVTRVTKGAREGYAFSVSQNGAAPVGGYFMASLKGFVRFPEKLVISKAKKARLQKSLRKQVAAIVASDSQFQPKATPAKPVRPAALPKPIVPGVRCYRCWSTKLHEFGVENYRCSNCGLLFSKKFAVPEPSENSTKTA